MPGFILRFLREESGATAVEYGLIAALISITIITAAIGVGGGVQGNFEKVQTAVQ